MVINLKNRVGKLVKNVYFFTFLWLLGISGGLTGLYNFEFKSGPEGKVTKYWPTETNIKRLLPHYQLVMFVHPHCPCTRASIRELEKIMAKTAGKLNAIVLFVRPSLFDEEWARSDLWHSSKAIPNVTCMIDDEGKEASCFGASNSGQTFLYDTEGNLLFKGGVTGSRGHEGNNIGINTVLSFVMNGTCENHTSPFFGCPLFLGNMSDKL